MLPPNAAGAALVRTNVDAAPEMTDRDTWPEPDMRLINDDRPPAPELEDDALPSGWEAWITAEAEARACPRDCVAAALICAVSGWVNNARRIMPGQPDWIEAAHLWFALIGAPSTGKTPALGPIIEASRKSDEMLSQHGVKSWRGMSEPLRARARRIKCGGSKFIRPRRKKPPHPTVRPPQKRRTNHRAHASLQWIPRQKNYNGCLLTTRVACFRYAMSLRVGSVGSIATAATVPIVDPIWNAGTGAPIYPIASSSMACRCGSSTHRSLSAAALFLTGFARLWPMQTTAFRHVSFLSGLSQCRSRLCGNTGLPTQRNDRSNCKRPRSDCTRSKWELTITAPPRRARCRLILTPASCSTSSGRRRCGGRGLRPA